MNIGDRFDLPEEGIHGTVYSAHYDLSGELVSVIIEMDNGQWATVDCTLIEPTSVTLH